jgi:hypothetical protein
MMKGFVGAALRTAGAATPAPPAATAAPDNFSKRRRLISAPSLTMTCSFSLDGANPNTNSRTDTTNDWII